MSEQFGQVKPELEKEKEQTKFFTAHLSLPSSDTVGKIDLEKLLLVHIHALVPDQQYSEVILEATEMYFPH